MQFIRKRLKSSRVVKLSNIIVRALRYVLCVHSFCYTVYASWRDRSFLMSPLPSGVWRTTSSCGHCFLVTFHINVNKYRVYIKYIIYMYVCSYTHARAGVLAYTLACVRSNVGLYSHIRRRASEPSVCP